MANKPKSTAKKESEGGALQSEKEEKVALKQLLMDDRTHKITGAILLLFGMVLFIAFTSFLFTWQEDYAVVHSLRFKILLPSHDVQVNNLLGTLGAFLSYFLISQGFGVASFLICTFFFAFGANLFFERKLFSIIRNLKYVLIGVVIFSVAFEVFLSDYEFPWGGAVGVYVKDVLFVFIGKLGTIALLLVALLSYIIWRFASISSSRFCKCIPWCSNFLPAF
jgi:S-DNA-T family DNA segregation ATPase FtsK/SpoIIIE